MKTKEKEMTEEVKQLRAALVATMFCVQDLMTPFQRFVEGDDPEPTFNVPAGQSDGKMVLWDLATVPGPREKDTYYRASTRIPMRENTLLVDVTLDPWYGPFDPENMEVTIRMQVADKEWSTIDG